MTTTSLILLYNTTNFCDDMSGKPSWYCKLTWGSGKGKRSPLQIFGCMVGLNNTLYPKTHPVISLPLKEIVQGVLMNLYRDFLKVLYKYITPNREHFQHNIYYYVWLGTGSIIFLLYLILLLYCMHIWTHIIIEKREMMSLYDSYGPGLSVGIKYWPIS